VMMRARAQMSGVCLVVAEIEIKVNELRWDA